jgi:hypothetical protein
MTGGMQEHPVVYRITASVGPPDDVMIVPARQSGDLLMADRAKTLLVFPEVQQLPSTFQVVCHLHAYTCFEGSRSAATCRCAGSTWWNWRSQ